MSHDVQTLDLYWEFVYLEVQIFCSLWMSTIQSPRPIPSTLSSTSPVVLVLNQAVNEKLNFKNSIIFSCLKVYNAIFGVRWNFVKMALVIRCLQDDLKDGMGYNWLNLCLNSTTVLFVKICETMCNKMMKCIVKHCLCTQVGSIILMAHTNMVRTYVITLKEHTHLFNSCVVDL